MFQLQISNQIANIWVETMFYFKQIRRLIILKRSSDLVLSTVKSAWGRKEVNHLIGMNLFS